MTKKTRKGQKGGGSFWDYFGFGNSDPSGNLLQSASQNLTAVTNDATQYLTNATNDATQYLTNATNAVATETNGILQQAQNIIPNTNPAETTAYSGGKYKRRRNKTIKTKRGGKGGLGLTYYASPISGLKVAEPTTWQYYANGTNQYSVKGGSKKHKNKKSRKNNK